MDLKTLESGRRWTWFGGIHTSGRRNLSLYVVKSVSAVSVKVGVAESPALQMASQKSRHAREWHRAHVFAKLIVFGILDLNRQVNYGPRKGC